MSIQQGILLVPSLDLHYIVIDLRFESFLVNIRGIILEILALEIQIHCTLHTTGTSNDSVRIGETKSFRNFLLILIENVFVSEAFRRVKEVVLESNENLHCTHTI
jgi:hypothetical protein